MPRITPLTLGGIVLAAACGGPPPPAMPPDAVASFDGGTVSAEELDQELRWRSQEGRTDGDVSLEALEEVTRDLALERTLAEGAMATGSTLAQEVASRHAEIERQLITRWYLNQHLPETQEIGEDELRRIYDERASELSRPARRFTRHIFVRGQPQRSPGEALQRARRLRQRLAGGEPFSTLAGAESDSQTRHSGGNLGWLSHDSVPRDLAAVVFGLEVGEPSEPVVAKGGVHLFLVEEAESARTFSYDEVRLLLARELELEQRQQTLDGLMASLPMPDGLELPSPDEVRDLLEEGRGEEVVFSTGELRVRARDVWRRADRFEGAQLAADPLQAAIRRLELQERIFHDRPSPLPGDLAAAIARTQRQTAAAAARRELIVAMVEADEEELQRFFEEGFSELRRLPEVRVRVLELPLEELESPLAALAQVEALHRRGPVSLEDVQQAADRLGGRVVDRGWLGFNGVAALFPGPVRTIMELPPGRLGPPARSGELLQAIYVVEHRDPRPLRFDEARERVVQQYLRIHGAELSRRLDEELAAEISLRVDQQRLRAFANARLGAPVADSPGEGELSTGP